MLLLGRKERGGLCRCWGGSWKDKGLVAEVVQFGGSRVLLEGLRPQRESSLGKSYSNTKTDKSSLLGSASQT